MALASVAARKLNLHHNAAEIVNENHYRIFQNGRRSQLSFPASVLCS